MLEQQNEAIFNDQMRLIRASLNWLMANHAASPDGMDDEAMAVALESYDSVWFAVDDELKSAAIAYSKHWEG